MKITKTQLREIIREELKENSSTGIKYHGNIYWVRSDKLDNQNSKVFAFTDSGLKNVAKLNGRTLMFRVKDIQDILIKESIIKSDLKAIIREEIQRLSETTLTKGDYIRYYDKFKGGKMDWYIMYIDSTHVAVTTDKPKGGKVPSGSFVAHIRQLKDRPYYRDMMKWMDSGDKKHIDGKTYSDN